MKLRFPSPLFAALIAAFPVTAIAGKVYYSVSELASDSTGLLESYVAGDWYRGSAVIARDPKLLYSCAHLFYEGGKWATDYKFYRANHSRDFPDEATGASPRGLHYFTSYSSGVKSYGSDSEEVFASDFTVLYGNSSFGSAVGWWPKGGPVLRSSAPKRIIGYPSDIDFTGDSGFSYQHSTGWFNYEAYRVRSGFHEFDDVSTGPGNSGGPIFVRNTGNGQDLLAGILVSGTRRSAGVVALDLSTNTLAGYALGLKNRTLTFTNGSGFKLPDGTRSYSVIPIEVSGFTGTVARLKLGVSIATKYRGDLDVFLKSPSGKIRWIARGNGAAGDFILTGKDLTGSYSGSSPNGRWELRVRDFFPGARASFKSASITISAL
jgi:hypothetical protein